MEKIGLEELNQRINQLEKLAWGLFRVLETYITYNELPIERKKGEVRTRFPDESD